MSATTAQPPIVPPRPSRSQDRDQMPKVPPRPVNRRLERSSSPNRDRFAPSPLNESPLLKSPRSNRFPSSNLSNSNNGSSDPIDRSSSVEMPSVGEEGKEYAAVEELSSSREQSTSPEQARRGSSPEQTRSVGQDLKLHAPKPSLPAVNAKQRVAAVTRTDSDRAASFGFGKPSTDEQASSNRSLRKKASMTSQLSTTTDSHLDDEQGIPEIGQQVPMYPNAGDVQAPSPAPGTVSAPGEGFKAGRHHIRKTSARGFADLPPGSYGLHGHGIKSQDKLERLERAYYEKHPELIRKEHTPHHHDRANDFSMSRDELNKIVRESASRGIRSDVGTPSEQVGWQAIEESTSRITSPRPASTRPKSDSDPKSPSKHSSYPEISISDSDKPGDDVVHVEDPNRRKSVMFNEEDLSGSDRAEESRYNAPILADDEVAKHPADYHRDAAVSPPLERSGSAFEMEPSSRPTSRPASIYKDSSLDIRSTPLEDVEEYEPLFPEDDKSAKQDAPQTKKTENKKQRFPGRDIWEDAPDSVHHTAEVSTPDVTEAPEDKKTGPSAPPVEAPSRHETETPAHAFARHHEQLAEAESKASPDAFLNRSQKPMWVQSQPHLATEVQKLRRPSAQRFPSQDVWEDTPDSHMLETTVENEQQEHEAPSPTEYKPDVPQRSAKAEEKPSVPERPKPKHTPSDDGTTLSSSSKPTIPDRPKPQVPARPAKSLSGSSSGSKEPEAAAPAVKAKPAVPTRPLGSKIAALQGGFLSDLNNRLKAGFQPPQAKKEEPAAGAQDLTEEKEKAPLVDARKGRARGPQRRAPAKSPAPAAAAAATPEKEHLSFSFSQTLTVFSLDPDEGSLSISGDDDGDDGAPAKQATAAEPVLPEDQASETPAAETTVAAAEAETEASEQDKPTVTETLATNMAGEAIVEADVKKPDEQTGACEG